MPMVPPEPTMVINGVTLTEGQAMTVRVALTTWLGFTLPDMRLELGELGDHYAARADEVLGIMLKSNRDTKGT